MGAAGYFIGNTKGRGPLGALMGLFLGPIGWVVVLLMPAAGGDALSPDFLARRASAQTRYGNRKTPEQLAKEDAWRKAQGIE